MTGCALIAYDGSDRSRRAIAAAAGLVNVSKAVVLHVGEVPVVAPALAGIPDLPPGDRLDRDAVRVEAQRITDDGVRIAQEAGFDARGEAMATAGGSSIPEAIVTLADEVDASVIVLGSHGHGAMRQALLGSVSCGVTHRTSRPVLVVPTRG